MISWKAFEARYDKREQWAFENMAHWLFCAEMDCHIGLFSYKNQAGIETDPIEKDGKFYGFQAKYYSPSNNNKNDIIDAIQKAKTKNVQLNIILLYVKEFSESSKKNEKKPKYQIDIEQAATQAGIEIEWRVRSHLEYQLSQPQNKGILDIFFGDNGLSPDFFKNQVEKEIANLGPRFNEKLNFELPIAQLFDNLAHNELFYNRFIKSIDKWLSEKNYRKLKDNEHISELETELETLKNELVEWIKKYNYSLDAPISLTSFIDKLQQFDKKVANKREELYAQKDWKNAQNKFDNELSRLREIEDSNDDFLTAIEKLKINLTNNPTLIIQGEAGCGKSHLLGDIATQRKKQSLPTILLLGTTFNKTDTIEKNILNKLDLSCTFNDSLTNLNSIGQQINSRVLILIDAINEGAGADLWKNQIAGFINEIAKFPAIGLVLTIRNTYFHDIIPDNFKADSKITTVTHTGFKGNEYEALKLFCEYHGLKLPNFPILNPEYSNPLFLHLVCEAVKNLPDKSFPKGFNGINKTYNLYKDALNRRFAEKRPEYKNRNIVSSAIEKFADALFNTEYGQLECKDAVSLFDIEFSQFPYLLSDLIEECVFIKMRYEYSETPKDLIFFAYQKLGDFFMAEELLKPYKSKKELKNAFVHDIKFQKIINKYQWTCRGIVEAFSILLPEKYNLELFELIDFFCDKNVDMQQQQYYIQNTYEWFVRILSDSLKWREISSIDEKKITEWLENNNKYIGYDEWLYTLTELSAISNHPFNSDRLHSMLQCYSMPERDSFWQQHIRWYSGYNDDNVAFPIQRLIDWAWSPNISYNTDAETARLVSQTLSWILSSTDIALRDQTTKALVNLLEQQPETLLQTLKAFEKVDDLYILERLYAVAYGCILRTEQGESIKIIAQYIYDTIFKNGNPPVHILLRDYARNAVEYAIYKNVELDIDVSLIRPPYNSQCNYTPLSNEELDEKYKPKDDNGHWGKDEWGITAILHSMVTEYGRGICGYGDFGRYTFQNNLSNFNLPDKLNVDLLSNLAVEWIFEKYGYNPELHGEYDRIVSDSHYIREYKIERIGKKYQWLALYEILARVADNYKFKDDWWSSDSKYEYYKGTWQNYLRNIDPAYITKNKDENEDDIINTKKEWWEDEEYTHWNFPDAEWVQTIKDLISPENIIQKQDTQVNEWLRLQHYITWREPKKIGKDQYEGRRKDVWYMIQGYLVRKTDKQKVINYLKNQNFWGRWMPENRDDHSTLINREKFWSPAYLDTYKENKKIWSIIRDTSYKILVVNESAKGLIESDKSGANQSYNIPCKFIFEGMGLQYAPIDGDLRNADGETIVTNNNSSGVLIRKKDLIQFLDNNNLDIIWTLLGEKLSFINNQNEKSYSKVPCGVYYLENGQITGELKMYDRD